MWVGGQRQGLTALLREGNPVPIVEEAGWDPGPVWTGAENLAPSGVRTSDHPARRESYRLRYSSLS